MKRKTLMFVLLAAAVLILSLAGCRDTKPAPTPQTPTAAPTEGSTSPTEGGTPTEESTSPTGESTLPTDPVTPSTDPVGSPPSTGDAIAALAMDLVGTAFQMGAAGPDRFDNSGFVYYCCRQNGVNVPRRTSEVVNFGVEVAWEDLRPGDVVLFSDEVGGPATFEGIYIGAAQFVSCNNPDTPTKVNNMAANYWKDRFIGGRRPE